MSILIKGMEMPKGCATCPYCDRAWNKPKCKAKSMQGRFMEQRLNLDRTRQKWCPLVPVPPHGRLIDADALYTRMEKAHTDWREHPEQYNGVIPVNADEIFVLTEAVIIPAEEGEI